MPIGLRLAGSRSAHAWLYEHHIAWDDAVVVSGSRCLRPLARHRSGSAPNRRATRSARCRSDCPSLLASAASFVWAATTDRHHKGAFVAAAIAGVLGISTLTLRSKAVPRMVSLAIVALGVGLAGYLKAKGVDFAFRDNLEYRFITYTLIMNLPVVVFARVLLSTRAAKRWCMTQAERSAVDELAASEERRVTEIAPASQPTDPPR